MHWSWTEKQSFEALTSWPPSQPLAFTAPRHLHGTLGFHRVQIRNHCFSELSWHVILQNVKVDFIHGFCNRLIPNQRILATYKSSVLFYVNQLDHCQPGWLLKALVAPEVLEGDWGKVGWLQEGAGPAAVFTWWAACPRWLWDAEGEW